MEPEELNQAIDQTDPSLKEPVEQPKYERFILFAVLIMLKIDGKNRQIPMNLLQSSPDGLLTKFALEQANTVAVERAVSEFKLEPKSIYDVVITSIMDLGWYTKEQFFGMDTQITESLQVESAQTEQG